MLLERLRRRARSTDTSPSTLAHLLVEEGMRMAVRYFAAHEQETLRRIEDDQQTAQEARAVWEAQQRLLL